VALAGLGVIVSLVVRPPRTVPAATWRLVIGLTAMLVLAPATRFGYFVYPAGLLAWLEMSRRGREVPDEPDVPAHPSGRFGSGMSGSVSRLWARG
jgi:hypothetical protein